MLQSGRHDRDFYEALWREIRENDHWQGEIWNRRKDGSVYPEWLTISAVRDKDGRSRQLHRSVHRHQPTQALAGAARFPRASRSADRRCPTGFLRERIERAIASGRSARRSRALLFLDLDRFKTINDSLGHSVGDELLVLAGKRWKRRLRPSDLLARLGGDEFVVLFEPADSPEEATRLAGELIAAMSEPFVFSDGCEAYVGLSIGITMFPSDEASADDLIQRADSALYAAKEGGGGMRFYSPAQTLAARARLDMEAGLRRALERDELVLQYQPQITIGDRRATGRRGAGALALGRPA